MTIYFTSDTHFGHERIILYSQRPFKNVEQMNRELVDNWNAVVKPGDTVYHLGDFSFMREAETNEIIRSLKGKIILTRGNHDRKMSAKTLSLFHRAIGEADTRCAIIIKVPYTTPDGEDKTQVIHAGHFPGLTWESAHHGAWMLHGHSHGNMKYPMEGKIMDVSVECTGYTPISFEQIQALMETKSFSAVDHHD